jgi:hypothetical protein
LIISVLVEENTPTPHHQTVISRIPLG